MKKLITTISLFTLAVTLSFGASKKGGKSGGIKLDLKKKFAIEGVELGSIDWCQNDATLTPKGEIIWAKEKEGDDYRHYGWELRGTDMSKYAGLKLQIEPLPDKDDLKVELENPASAESCTFLFEKDGICYVFFNGSGRAYGGMKNPDPTEGYQIRFMVRADKLPKTVIKSIELLSKEDYPDASYLDLLGVQFGTSNRQTRIIGNEITWPKGYSEGNAGWNLEGIDLSEYDRLRVELESNDATGLHISLNEQDGKNYHTFSTQIEPNVFEANLNGEGYSYKNDDSVTPDRSKGLSLDIRTWNEKPRTKDQKTVVKSVQLLKGKSQTNKNLILEGKLFGLSCWHAVVYEGGIIEWEANRDKCGLAGWNLSGVDLSKYKKIRIVLGDEAAKQSFDLKMTQDDCHLYFKSISPTVLEANLDGSGHTNIWPAGAKWDTSKGINEIQIQINNLTKNQKTTVKSVTLLEEDDSIPQPEAIMLNGSKLGTSRNNTWIDDDFSINWNVVKSEYAKCGWNFDKLDGEILEIKVASTDVPLRLRIRENADGNESSWMDDGSHIFRINLKTKKQIAANGSTKAEEWSKSPKALDFSQGGEIVFEAPNGVYKEGKKTVVEYIKME